MIHRDLIASAKTFAVVVASAGRDVGVTILIAVAHVRSPVVIEVLASAFNPIVKSLPLYISELLRWVVPSTILTVSRGCRQCKLRSHKEAGSRKHQSE
jgi:hypothetical protein